MKYRHTTFLLLTLTVTLSCSIFRHPAKTYEPEMVLVEGGEFIVGDFYEESNSDALPLHKQTVKPFYISKYETTFEQYDQFALSSNRKLPNDRNSVRGKRAVVNVNWDDAMAFCKSVGMRLPTEVEWEYAARSQGKNELFSGTNSADSLGYYALTQRSDMNFSFPVGQFKPNSIGLYDMSGNVFEWVDEFYQFYTKPDELHDHKNDAIRIIRGGSFFENFATTRTYWRAGTLRDVEASDIGFRCARSK